MHTEKPYRKHSLFLQRNWNSQKEACAVIMNAPQAYVLKEVNTVKRKTELYFQQT